MAGFLQVTEVVTGRADFRPQAAGLQKPPRCSTPASETLTREGRELAENAEGFDRTDQSCEHDVRECRDGVCSLWSLQLPPIDILHCKQNVLYFGRANVESTSPTRGGTLAACFRGVES